MKDSAALQAMTPEQREVFMCSRVARDIYEVTKTYPGLGTWERGWVMTLEASERFTKALVRWAVEMKPQQVVELQRAHKAYLRAWGSAATAWAREGRPA